MIDSEKLSFGRQVAIILEKLDMQDKQAARYFFCDPSKLALWKNDKQIPGWGESFQKQKQLSEKEADHWVNKGRSEILTFVQLVIMQAAHRHFISSEDIDNLLLSAAYAPLQADDPLERRIKEAFTRPPVNSISHARKLAGNVQEMIEAIYATTVLKKPTLTATTAETEDSETIVIYPPDQPRSEWHRLVSELEKQPGSRLLITSEFAPFCLPESIRIRFARSHNLNQNDLALFLTGRQERFEEWKDQARLYEQRDIFEIATLLAALRGEILYRGTLKFERDELSQQVNTLLNLLEEFPLYRIGLSDSSLNDRVLIKNNQVMYDSSRTQPTHSYRRNVGVIIRSNEAVARFTQDFEVAWQNCRYTKREQVYDFIQRAAQLAGLTIN